MQKLLLVYYHSENRATSQIWKALPNMVFPPIWGENGGVLSMRMQVILDSSFAHPGSAPIWGGKKVEFRDWTIIVTKLWQCLLLYIFFYLYADFNFKRLRHFIAGATIIRVLGQQQMVTNESRLGLE